MKTPRDYQLEAVNNTLDYWSGGGGSALIELPTGAGKSLVMAYLTQQLVQQFDGTRVVILTHVQELVEQDAEEMQELWPEAPIGIYSAGLGKRDGGAPIVFASVQSVAKDPSILGDRHVAMIDEAHLLSRKDDGNYQKVLNHLKNTVPSMRLGGFTATPYRTDTGLLTDSWRDKPPLFDDIVYKIDPLTLINRGILSPLVPYAPHTALDMSGVKIQGGEFNAKQMQAAVDKSDVSERAMDEVVMAGADRAGWIVFAAGVEHAQHLRDMLRARNIESEMILGDTPAGERKDIIARFKRREFRAIVGNNVLTTGFNAPHIDLIAVLRPTASKGLHVQMLGRGLRRADGKDDCVAEGSLVLTNVGLVPIEDVTIEMMVWDGVEFVAHSGVVCRGEQHVVEYAGLTATPDHKVWTSFGWKEIEECLQQEIEIFETGDNCSPIRLTEGRKRKGVCGQKWKTENSVRMHGLQGSQIPFSKQRSEWKRGMSGVRSGAKRATLAFTEMLFGKDEVRKQTRSPLSRLWWSRDKVSIRESEGNGDLDTRKSWDLQEFGDRQGRQRPSLRARKPEVVDPAREHQQYASPVQRHVRVWDVLNAGPRHRFTVNGLLVSNCLVLDFARNVQRHGAMDMIDGSKTPGEGGKAPVKECDSCGRICPASIRKCPGCGYEFPVLEDIKFAARSAGTPIFSNQQEPVWYDIERIYVRKHVKRNDPDAKPSLRIDYATGFTTVSHFVVLEHPTSGGMARRWWERNSYSGEAPQTVDEAIERIDDLRIPGRIQTMKDGKYTRIVFWDYAVPPGKAIPVMKELSYGEGLR